MAPKVQPKCMTAVLPGVGEGVICGMKRDYKNPETGEKNTSKIAVFTAKTGEVAFISSNVDPKDEKSKAEYLVYSTADVDGAAHSMTGKRPAALQEGIQFAQTALPEQHLMKCTSFKDKDGEGQACAFTEGNGGYLMKLYKNGTYAVRADKQDFTASGVPGQWVHTPDPKNDNPFSPVSLANRIKATPAETKLIASYIPDNQNEKTN